MDEIIHFNTFQVSGIKQYVIVRQVSVDRLPLLLLSPEKVKNMENVIASFSLWGKGLAMMTGTDDRQQYMHYEKADFKSTVKASMD